MKTATFFYISLLLLGTFFTNIEAKSQPAEVNFSIFHDNLSPYGRWMDNPTYGQVWVYNEPGFRPYYTNGHWELTDYGWTWASNYDWGWAPFHYGRWEYDAFYGWMWIPGYEWAPAWVTWSQAGDYYGWAPLGFGVDINIAIGRIPYDRWVFAPRQYITRSRIDDYCAPFNRNRYYYRNSRAIGNIYEDRNARYMYGPDRYEVERVTNSRIEPRRTDETRWYSNRTMDRNRNENNQQNNRPNATVRSFDNNEPEMNGRDNNLPRREVIIPNNTIQEQQRIQRPWQNRANVNEPPAQNNNNLPVPQRDERNSNPLDQRMNNETRTERHNFPLQQQKPMEQRDNQPRGFNQKIYGGERIQSEQRTFGERPVIGNNNSGNTPSSKRYGFGGRRD